MKALNRLLDDLYGQAEIVKAGIIPPDLIYQNTSFRPEMKGKRPPHGIYVHIAGVDIVRTGESEFYVLEDNARTPSGVSYMLENREVMIRLFPGSRGAPPHRADRQLHRPAAVDPALGRAAKRERRSERRRADAGHV